MSETIARIEIEYTEDGMFGADPDNREGVDISASFDKWVDLLTVALCEVYPNAEVSIENTLGDKHSAQFTDGFEDDYETAIVGEIIHRVWESWDWVVYDAQFLHDALVDVTRRFVAKRATFKELREIVRRFD